MKGDKNLDICVCSSGDRNTLDPCVDSLREQADALAQRFDWTDGYWMSPSSPVQGKQRYHVCITELILPLGNDVSWALHRDRALCE